MITAPILIVKVGFDEEDPYVPARTFLNAPELRENVEKVATQAYINQPALIASDEVLGIYFEDYGYSVPVFVCGWSPILDQAVILGRSHLSNCTIL